MTEEELIQKTLVRCHELNFVFLGFAEKFIGRKTHLKLQCANCKKIWKTTTFQSLMRKDKTPHKCKKKQYDINLTIKKVKQHIEQYLNKEKFELKSIQGESYFDIVLFLFCKNCKQTFTYSYPQFMTNKGKLNCKHCEHSKKLSKIQVLNFINTKCKEMNYTFLGFDNEENEYKNTRTRLILQCNNCGRIWKTTNYDRFVRKTLTCINCHQTWTLERDVELILSTACEYKKQKTFPWLKNKQALKLDFYLPQYNIAIECQGGQHFQPVEYFGGEKTFKAIQQCDKIKKQLCEEHNIKLIYYSTNTKNNTFLGEKILKNKQELKEILQKYGKKD